MQAFKCSMKPDLYSFFSFFTSFNLLFLGFSENAWYRQDAYWWWSWTAPLWLSVRCMYLGFSFPPNTDCANLGLPTFLTWIVGHARAVVGSERSLGWGEEFLIILWKLKVFLLIFSVKLRISPTVWSWKCQVPSATTARVFLFFLRLSLENSQLIRYMEYLPDKPSFWEIILGDSMNYGLISRFFRCWILTVRVSMGPDRALARRRSKVVHLVCTSIYFSEKPSFQRLMTGFYSWAWDCEGRGLVGCFSFFLAVLCFDLGFSELSAENARLLLLSSNRPDLLLTDSNSPADAEGSRHFLAFLGFCN